MVREQKLYLNGYALGILEVVLQSVEDFLAENKNVEDALKACLDLLSSCLYVPKLLFSLQPIRFGCFRVRVYCSAKSMTKIHEVTDS